MGNLTTYLDQHPVDAAFALGQVGSAADYQRKVEMAELVGYSEGRLIYWSGLLNVVSIGEVNHHFIYYPRNGKRVRLSMIYSIVHRGFPHTVKINLPNSYTSKRSSNTSRGGVRVHVDGSDPAFPTAVRNARRRSERAIASPFPGGFSVPYQRSTNLRPSPEVVNRQFLRIIENKDGFTGTYGISQTVIAQLVFRRTWTGVRTPGWGKLKPRSYPDNPHTVRIVENRVNKWSQFLRSKSNSGYNYQLLPYTENIPSPNLEPGHSPLARNKAIRKLIDSSELGIDANLAQDFAQMRQLTTLIGTNTRKIVKAVRQVKRFDFLGAADTLTAGRRTDRSSWRKAPSRTKDLADNWLELQYGWKPLLQDIEGTLKSLSNYNGSNDFVRSVRVSASAEGNNRWVSFPGNADAGSKDQGVSTQTWKTTCRFTLRYKVNSPLKSFLAQTGFTNPINLVWEILPFSFVADWFIPIGPYLEALTAWDGLTFLGGSQTLFTKARTDTALDYNGDNVLNSDGIISRHGRHSADTVWLDRSVLSDFPTPTFPSFKNGLASVTHAANGIALIKSIFHGK